MVKFNIREKVNNYPKKNKNKNFAYLDIVIFEEVENEETDAQSSLDRI